MDTLYRRVSVVLPDADFEALQQLAEREERTPREQATYFVRKSLAAQTAGSLPVGTRDDRGPEAA